MSRVLLVVLVVVAGCESDEPASSVRGTSPEGLALRQEVDVVFDDVARAAYRYQELRLMTPEAAFVSPDLAAGCLGVSAQMVRARRGDTGPHTHTMIRVYMSDAAAGVFEARSGEYPVGAVIVKEKVGLSYWVDSPGGEHESTANGVGGMIKREPGFDAGHGDWEYFYVEEGVALERGRIATCVGCHSRAAGRDYVFGGWAER